MKSIKDVELAGRTVLCRVDYNVPIKNGNILDDTRIRMSLPTLNYILNNDATLILCSHLGRPKGKVIPELSLRPIAKHLEKLLGQSVVFIEGVIDENTRSKILSHPSSKVFLLENTRFHPGEKSNDPEFSQLLATLADVYVSDAFGTVHRAHASTQGVTRFLPGYAGLLVMNEYEKITTSMENPRKPSLAIFGGAKISTKLDVIHNFIGRVDTLVLGGGMANTFLKAMRHDVGNSLIENDMIDTAKDLIKQIKEAGMTLILPSDVRIAKSIDEPILENNQAKIVDIQELPSNAMILDIGDQTLHSIIEEVNKAETIIWNGPMGVFENELYRKGTISLARAILERNVQTVIGGGETAYAINMLNMEIPENIHVSTGGGASLELMAGKSLPGVMCLTGQVMG